MGNINKPFISNTLTNANVSKCSINKQSRLFFHIALKSSRIHTVQEKRYTKVDSKDKEASYYKELHEILKEQKIEYSSTMIL